MIPIIKRASLKTKLFFSVTICLLASLLTIRWSLAIPLPSPEVKKIIYTSQTGADLKRTFAKAITSAKHSIYLRIYGLTDPDILALLQKKGEEGVVTVVVYDDKGSLHKPKQLGPKIQAYPIELKGKAAGLMHQKILVIDDERVFIGTANMTPSSLGMHDNMVIGLHSPTLAHNIKHTRALLFPFEEGEFWNLPDKNNRALTHLIALIDGAHTSLDLAMFTFTHPQLSDALIRAKNRGVAVNVAIDKYASRGAGKKITEKLESSGITVHSQSGWRLIHHKWLLIDDKILVVGSANWTRSAFTSNEDCFLVLNNLSPAEIRKLKSTWSRCNL